VRRAAAAVRTDKASTSRARWACGVMGGTLCWCGGGVNEDGRWIARGVSSRVISTVPKRSAETGGSRVVFYNAFERGVAWRRVVLEGVGLPASIERGTDDAH